MTHWAFKYVGKSYHEVGMCWGLVQLVCRERFSIKMPCVAVGARDEQTIAIKQAAELFGWKRDYRMNPLPDDIVVMMNQKERHVGFAVLVDGGVGVLHACRKAGVVFDNWTELLERGCHSFEYWSRN